MPLGIKIKITHPRFAELNALRMDIEYQVDHMDSDAYYILSSRDDSKIEIPFKYCKEV